MGSGQQEIAPTAVRNVRFGRPRTGRRGYDEREVDAFLDLIERSLLGSSVRITAQAVHDIAFSRPGLGRHGYDGDEVDAFLELIEAELHRRGRSR